MTSKKTRDTMPIYAVFVTEYRNVKATMDIINKRYTSSKTASMLFVMVSIFKRLWNLL